jgi:hypothetical protein
MGSESAPTIILARAAGWRVLSSGLRQSPAPICFPWDQQTITLTVKRLGSLDGTAQIAYFLGSPYSDAQRLKDLLKADFLQPGGGYGPPTGTVVFNPGESEKVITIPVPGGASWPQLMFIDLVADLQSPFPVKVDSCAVILKPKTAVSIVKDLFPGSVQVEHAPGEEVETAGNVNGPWFKLVFDRIAQALATNKAGFFRNATSTVARAQVEITASNADGTPQTNTVVAAPDSASYANLGPSGRTVLTNVLAGTNIVISLFGRSFTLSTNEVYPLLQWFGLDIDPGSTNTFSIQIR